MHLTKQNINTIYWDGILVKGEFIWKALHILNTIIYFPVVLGHTGTSCHFLVGDREDNFLIICLVCFP